MQSIRNSFKIVPALKTTLTQQRPMSVVSGPATKKVPKAEVFFLASILAVGWLTIPAWVLVNIKHYSK